MKFRMGRARIDPATFKTLFRIRRGSAGAVIVKAEGSFFEVFLEHFHDRGFVRMEERDGRWRCPVCGEVVEVARA